MFNNLPFYDVNSSYFPIFTTHTQQTHTHMHNVIHLSDYNNTYIINLSELLSLYLLPLCTSLNTGKRSAWVQLKFQISVKKMPNIEGLMTKFQNLVRNNINMQVLSFQMYQFPVFFLQIFQFTVSIELRNETFATNTKNSFSYCCLDSVLMIDASHFSQYRDVKCSIHFISHRITKWYGFRGEQKEIKKNYMYNVVY